VNHSARLNCGPAKAPTLLIGSHLDSVPNGGRFDGALGVVAALEVLLSLRDAEINLPFNLEAIDFTDEEGTISGLLGSLALAGKLTSQMLAEPRGGREKLVAGLSHAGLTEMGLLSAGRTAESLAGYLELHIEQGPRLLAAGAGIGIVTSIVGIGSCRLTFAGRADHAGTTPMDARQDAAQGASDFTLALHQRVRTDYPNCTANIGRMDFAPGAFNIVPERVAVALEYRAPDPVIFESLEAGLLKLANESARKFGLGLAVEYLGKHAPAPMAAEVQTTFQRAAESLGLAAIPLTSGAGHDAQSLASLCPAGMIFVPSVGGASHSPREFTEWQDCVNGANVLLLTILEGESWKWEVGSGKLEVGSWRSIS